jgi:hypothetical protein
MLYYPTILTTQLYSSLDSEATPQSSFPLATLIVATDSLHQLLPRPLSSSTSRKSLSWPIDMGASPNTLYP